MLTIQSIQESTLAALSGTLFAASCCHCQQFMDSKTTSLRSKTTRCWRFTLLISPHISHVNKTVIAAETLIRFIFFDIEDRSPFISVNFLLARGRHKANVCTHYIINKRAKKIQNKSVGGGRDILCKLNRNSSRSIYNNCIHSPIARRANDRATRVCTKRDKSRESRRRFFYEIAMCLPRGFTKDYFRVPIIRQEEHDQNGGREGGGGVLGSVNRVKRTNCVKCLMFG